MGSTRRQVLTAGSAGIAAFASWLLWPRRARAEDEATQLVEQLIGKAAKESDRLRLLLPPEFPTGYTVPMSLDIDSPMTEADHVRQIRVFAPLNPIVEIVGFRFQPRLSVPRVSTRIRLAKPQWVVAVAEMSDGALLMAKARVDVATDGCA